MEATKRPRQVPSSWFQNEDIYCKIVRYVELPMQLALRLCNQMMHKNTTLWTHKLCLNHTTNQTFLEMLDCAHVTSVLVVAGLPGRIQRTAMDKLSILNRIHSLSFQDSDCMRVNEQLVASFCKISSHLRRLSLKRCAGIISLDGIPNMARVEKMVLSPSSTNNTLMSLARKCGFALKVLDGSIGCENIGNEGIQCIVLNCKELTTLTLIRAPRIGMGSIRNILAELPWLRILKVCYCDQVYTEDFVELINVVRPPQLQSITYASERQSQEVKIYQLNMVVRSCTNLTTLNFGQKKIWPRCPTRVNKFTRTSFI